MRGIAPSSLARVPSYFPATQGMENHSLSHVRNQTLCSRDRSCHPWATRAQNRRREKTNSLNSLFSVRFSTFSPCLQEFTRNDSHSSLTLIIVFNYGALSLFSSTTLFMQRICFGIFQRLGVESSSKNIGNKRKMSHLDCFKP